MIGQWGVSNLLAEQLRVGMPGNIRRLREAWSLPPTALPDIVLFTTAGPLDPGLDSYPFGEFFHRATPPIAASDFVDGQRSWTVQYPLEIRWWCAGDGTEDVDRQRLLITQACVETLLARLKLGDGARILDGTVIADPAVGFDRNHGGFRGTSRVRLTVEVEETLGSVIAVTDVVRISAVNVDTSRIPAS